jgi:acyl carrier protein
VLVEKQATSGDNATLEKLVEIISGRLEWPTDGGAPGPDTRIGEDGLGLDSLMIVEFALDIEEQFGFEVDEDEMLNLGGMTLAEVVAFIERRAAEPAP